MRINKILLFSVIFTLFISCQKQSNIDKLTENFNIALTSENTVVLLIPLSGCSSCINPSITFVKSNIGKKNIICIVSSIGKKVIQFRFSDNEINNKNFISDTKSHAIDLKFIYNKPVAFFISKKKLIKQIEFDAKNSKPVFNDILSFVN